MVIFSHEVHVMA